MNIKIEEARKMNKKEIEIELGKRGKVLEDFGMTHAEACDFISGIMNLGIAAQEMVGYLNDFDGDTMVTVQVNTCKMCNGKRMVPIGHGIRGIKPCPLCNGGKL